MAQDLQDSLDSGDICFENGPKVEDADGSAIPGQPSINLSGLLLLQAQSDYQAGGGDSESAGYGAVLAGILAHELQHTQGETGEAYPYSVAIAVLNAVAAQYASNPDALAVICLHVRAYQKEIMARTGAPGPSSGICDEFDLSQGDGDAPLQPWLPTYMPSGTLGYWLSPRLRELIDAIEIPLSLLGYYRAWLPQGGDTHPRYRLWTKDAELWVDRWNPVAENESGRWERRALSLNFKPTALTGTDIDQVFIAGQNELGLTVIRQYSFDLTQDRLTYTVDGVYSGSGPSVITDMAYLNYDSGLVALDAYQARLWTVDIDSGTAAVLSGSPSLSGYHSIHVVTDETNPAGATYVLTSRLPDEHTGEQGAGGVLIITDNDVTDGVLNDSVVY